MYMDFFISLNRYSHSSNIKTGEKSRITILEQEQKIQIFCRVCTQQGCWSKSVRIRYKKYLTLLYIM